jgi:hypothetical protein
MAVTAVATLKYDERFRWLFQLYCIRLSLSRVTLPIKSGCGPWYVETRPETPRTGPAFSEDRVSLVRERLNFK